GDICDATVVRDALKGVDAVVNMAACTHVDRSLMEPDEFLRTDVFGVFTLLEAVRELKIPRLLHISTDEVYGSVERGSSRESDPLRPSNPYSASKAGGDLRYSLDAKKVQQLGWAPRHKFGDALATTVAWYRAREAWWRPLKSGEFRAYYAKQYGAR